MHQKLVVDSHGNTPLHIGVKRNSVITSLMLYLQGNQDLRKKNSKGVSVIDLLRKRSTPIFLLILFKELSHDILHENESEDDDEFPTEEEEEDEKKKKKKKLDRLIKEIVQRLAQYDSEELYLLADRKRRTFQFECQQLRLKYDDKKEENGRSIERYKVLESKFLQLKSDYEELNTEKKTIEAALKKTSKRLKVTQKHMDTKIEEVGRLSMEIEGLHNNYTKAREQWKKEKSEMEQSNQETQRKLLNAFEKRGKLNDELTDFTRKLRRKYDRKKQEEVERKKQLEKSMHLLSEKNLALSKVTMKNEKLHTAFEDLKSSMVEVSHRATRLEGTVDQSTKERDEWKKKVENLSETISEMQIREADFMRKQQELAESRIGLTEFSESEVDDEGEEFGNNEIISKWKVPMKKGKSLMDSSVFDPPLSEEDDDDDEEEDDDFVRQNVIRKPKNKKQHLLTLKESEELEKKLRIVQQEVSALKERNTTKFETRISSLETTLQEKERLIDFLRDTLRLEGQTKNEAVKNKKKKDRQIKKLQRRVLSLEAEIEKIKNEQ